MSFALAFNATYFSGASRTLQVPGRFHCGLNGRGYMIDTARLQEFRRQSIPLLREQQDTTDSPGEQTLSPEELWRRSQDDWTHGAGQVHLDRKDSDSRRFRSSKGIDIWTRWQMSLLPGTAVRRSSANTGLALTPVGDRLYVLDGAGLFHTTNLTTFTAVTGGPATAPSSIASDGFNVYTAHGASGVYRTTRGAATTASHATGTVGAVGYVKGRLMAASGPSIYNVTVAGALPAALYTQPNTDWTWVGFAEGQAAIYAAGFSGDKSLVYRTAVKADGTALDVPVVAAELPDGEIIRSIYGYLGFLVLGTDLGVRFAAADVNGNLTIGALIRTAGAVRCFEGQDRFIWFGWTNYDDASTGLGRLDLSVFVSSLAPAHASDLMATGQGSVVGVATFRGVRVFAVDGLGFYEQTAALVGGGTLDTGLISFGLPDLKTAVYLDVKVAQPVDTNRAYISVDSGAFVLIGTRSSALVDPFTVGELSGEVFEVRHELQNLDAVTTAGPVVSRYTLRAYPRPSQGEMFMVPVLLHESVETLTDTYRQDPREEYTALVSLRESKRLTTFQLGLESHTVTVDDALMQYSHLTESNTAWNGTALLKLKSFAD